MIDHLGIKVADFERSKAFYDATLAQIGATMVMMIPPEAGLGKGGGYGRDRPCFWIQEGERRTGHDHIAFTAQSRADVDAFHAAAIAAGGRDNGAPGLRPHYHPNYYGAFVFDPDGNNVETVCHAAEAAA